MWRALIPPYWSAHDKSRTNEKGCEIPLLSEDWERWISCSSMCTDGQIVWLNNKQSFTVFADNPIVRQHKHVAVCSALFLASNFQLKPSHRVYGRLTRTWLGRVWCSFWPLLADAARLISTFSSAASVTKALFHSAPHPLRFRIVWAVVVRSDTELPLRYAFWKSQLNLKLWDSAQEFFRCQYSQTGRCPVSRARVRVPTLPPVPAQYDRLFLAKFTG